ncbi:MAG: acylphosphatase [Sphingomicrobium sp.]
MRVGRTVKVTGQVQGVVFRAWTKQQADQLHVSGWVRNCPDGSVEAHLEGDAEAVDQMIAAMKHGPDGAKVDRQEVAEAPAGHADRFDIRH